MNITLLIRTLALAFAVNSVASAAFVINEGDQDTPGTDNDEFIELKGDPFESTDGHIVVVYSRNSVSGELDSLHTFDIGGANADANGYYVLGGRDVVEADYRMPGSSIIPIALGAIALYQAPASSFPTGTLPTTTGLLDVLAFTNTDTPDPVDWSGLGSPTLYNENSAGSVTLLSLSRIPNQTGPFTPAGPSPKRENTLVSYSVSDPGFLLVNQETALVSQVLPAVIRNTNLTPLTITGIQLDAASSPQITISSGPTPGLPVTLNLGETVTVDLTFIDPTPTASTIYSTIINVSSDHPTSPSVSYNFSHQLVRGTPATVGAIKINELCYIPNGQDHNGDGISSTGTSQPDEFVELFNTTSNPILIEGWEQRNTNSDATARTFSFLFPAGATIPANGFVILFSGGTPTGFTPGTVFVAGESRLRNTGATVSLRDGTKFIDALAYLIGSTTPPDGFEVVTASQGAGGSIGRLPDGSTTWAPFSVLDPVPPTPNFSNTGVAEVSDWTLY